MESPWRGRRRRMRAAGLGREESNLPKGDQTGCPRRDGLGSKFREIRHTYYVSVGVPHMLQEGGRSGATRCAQANSPACGWRQEVAECKGPRAAGASSRVRQERTGKAPAVSTAVSTATPTLATAGHNPHVTHAQRGEHL